MKINGSQIRHDIQEHSSPSANAKKSSKTELPVDKVEIRARKIDRLEVKDNNPNDPTVSTKVLDSLHSGIINFDQEQREVIAKILSDKSNQL